MTTSHQASPVSQRTSLTRVEIIVQPVFIFPCALSHAAYGFEYPALVTFLGWAEKGETAHGG